MFKDIRKTLLTDRGISGRSGGNRIALTGREESDVARKMILIAGPSAAGKTRYAAHLEDRFLIPVISRDGIKETLFEALSLQADSIEAVQRYGSCAYDLLFYFAERLMRSGGDLALESNFTLFSRSFIRPLLDRYRYQTLTILFDAPSEILHQRFTARERSLERHKGHGYGLYNDFETFHKNAEKARQFACGSETMTVDASDFTKVDYDVIDRRVSAFLNDDPAR